MGKKERAANDNCLPLAAHEGIRKMWRVGKLHAICVRCRRYDSGSLLAGLTLGYDGRCTWFEDEQITDRYGLAIGWILGDLTVVFARIDADDD